ncbi:MAG: hypothetical protein JKY43_01200 [Phycisphaerales bacterium]|nr:hypothetical protein [Phycisphaerales bacterium]
MPGPKYTRKDLITSHKQIALGFLEQALAKTHEADEYIVEAKSFKQTLDLAKTIDDLIGNPLITQQLLAASGFSGKATTHLTTDEMNHALSEAIEKIRTGAGDLWREDLLFRYLLTKGDSLGGKLRNLTGRMGAEKFAGTVEKAIPNRYSIHKKNK